MYLGDAGVDGLGRGDVEGEYLDALLGCQGTRLGRISGRGENVVPLLPERPCEGGAETAGTAARDESCLLETHRVVGEWLWGFQRTGGEIKIAFKVDQLS